MRSGAVDKSCSMDSIDSSHLSDNSIELRDVRINENRSREISQSIGSKVSIIKWNLNQEPNINTANNTVKLSKQSLSNILEQNITRTDIVNLDYSQSADFNNNRN